MLSVILSCRWLLHFKNSFCVGFDHAVLCPVLLHMVGWQCSLESMSTICHVTPLIFSIHSLCAVGLTCKWVRNGRLHYWLEKLGNILIKWHFYDKLSRWLIGTLSLQPGVTHVVYHNSRESGLPCLYALIYLCWDDIGQWDVWSQSFTNMNFENTQVTSGYYTSDWGITLATSIGQACV